MAKRGCIVTPSEIEAIADAVADRVAAKLARADRAIDVHGVAALLGCSAPTVQRLIASGAIPSFKAGRLRRFDPCDVLASLKAKGGCDE